MNYRNRMRAFASVTAVAAALCSVPAYAQDSQEAVAPEVAAEAEAEPQGPVDTPSENSGQDTEIVVTAQKRAENVQDVPISIAAFSGESLTKSNVVNVQDLGKIASNFQATKGVQTSFLRVNIRGIGAAGNTTIEPSVAIFLDGSYVPRPGAVVGSMLDMESVEVLRGPQGTMFGRNASVGALSLHSATPKKDLDARVTAEIGNGDRYKVDGFVNVPLNDNIAVRLAGSQQWFGGYWKNLLDGEQVGGSDDTVVRGSLKADFDPVEWIIRADYSRLAGDGVTNSDFDADSVSPAQLANLRALLGGILPDTDRSDRKMNQFITADLEDEQWGISSQLSFDVGGGSTIRLINNYRDWQNDQLDGDVTFMPVPIISRTGNFSSKSQNHELQFISPARQWFDGRFEMVGGLYYFREKYRLDEQFHMGARYCGVLPAPFRPGCNAFLTANSGENATDQDVFQTTDSYAAYAQGTVFLTDQVSMILGGRYTKDSKEGSYRQTVTNPFVGANILRAPEALTFPDVEDDRFTYRLGLNYEPTEDFLFFGTYSTGYKSGGYNSGGGSVPLSVVDAQGNLVSTKRVFDRETVKNYELGAKTSWLDRKLTANLTLYRMEISGFQDRAFDGTSFTVLNAGELRQQGFEFDTVVKPMRNLSLFGSVGYVDSEFTDYERAPGLPGCAPTAAGIPPVCTAAGLGVTQNLEGNPVTFSPKWSGRVGFDYSGDVGSSGMSWNVNSNLSFFSKQYMGLVNDGNPQTIQPGYTVLGARVTLNGRDDRWSFSIFGNNLLDKNYTAGNFYQVLDNSFGLRNGLFPGSTAVRHLHADPRTYGASFTVRY